MVVGMPALVIPKFPNLMGGPLRSSTANRIATPILEYFFDKDTLSQFDIFCNSPLICSSNSMDASGSTAISLEHSKNIETPTIILAKCSFFI